MILPTKWLQANGRASTPSFWEDAITLIAGKTAIPLPTLVANGVLADPEDEYVALFAEFLPTFLGMDIINYMNLHEISRYQKKVARNTSFS